MKQIMIVVLVIFLSTFLGISACNKNDDKSKPENSETAVQPGDDPNFTIVVNNDEGLSSFNRKVVVFGIDIYAVPKVEDSKLLHAANVLAQYLDNDEDGNADNQLVLDKMIENKVFVVMWRSEDDLDLEPPADRIGQDLGNDETNPSFVTNDCSGRFDASLEELLHIVTHAGYSQAYPEIFGEEAGTAIADAMDIARGGQFTSIPNSYPEDAWYSYYDNTCDYPCQVAEYHYWALTSILGAQKNRLEEIGEEWRLNTKEKVETQDVAAFHLLTDPQYKFPAVLPDGTYKH